VPWSVGFTPAVNGGTLSLIQVVAAYGPNSRIDNIAVECEDCNVVLHDVEPDMNEPEY